MNIYHLKKQKSSPLITQTSIELSDDIAMSVVKEALPTQDSLEDVKDIKDLRKKIKVIVR